MEEKGNVWRGNLINVTVETSQFLTYSRGGETKTRRLSDKISRRLTVKANTFPWLRATTPSFFHRSPVPSVKVHKFAWLHNSPLPRMHLSVRVNFVYECSFLLDLHFNFARGRLPFDGRPTERKPVPSLTRIMHKRRRPKLMAEMSHARARAFTQVGLFRRGIESNSGLSWFFKKVPCVTKTLKRMINVRWMGLLLLPCVLFAYKWREYKHKSARVIFYYSSVLDRIDHLSSRFIMIKFYSSL